MQVRGTAEVLTEREILQITEKALRILAEIGVRIPNARMLEMLSAHGAQVDVAKEVATFPVALVQGMIEKSERVTPDWQAPLTFHSGAYPEFYLPVRSTQVRRHTLETVTEMTRLTDYLPNIHGTYDALGVPSDVPPHLAPLYMRLTHWKHTRKGRCGQIQLTALLPYAVEMAEIMVDSEGGSINDYAFADVHMISPLQLGKEECEQYVYFWERGLQARFGQILTAGGTAPATLAGALSLNLAELLFLNFLHRVFYNDVKFLAFGNSVTVIDMKKAVFRYGRPELALTHLAMGNIARYYGAAFGANCFLGDAPLPSCEMGMQKALTAIPAILAGTRGLGTLGLLSVDEIGSPVQLIIDNEFAGALQRLARGFVVDEETLAFDVIKEVGPGGLFTGTEHTARHYRSEHWQPEIFTREMYNSWLAGDAKIDVQRAEDIFDHVMRTHNPRYIKEQTETALLAVIERAAQHTL
ncbi:MAG: trimethylamine methyltransferase family protein [Anaerolineae bacterium]